jgi:hypothetical protein
MGKEIDNYYRDHGWLLTPCQICQHLQYLGGPTGSDSKCEAFPNGIPLLIFSGTISHEIAYENDRDIQYAPSQTRILDGVKYKLGWNGVLEK